MIRKCKVKTSCSVECCDKRLSHSNLLPGYKLSITGDRVKEPGRYGNDDGITTNTTMFYEVSASSPKCPVPEHIGVEQANFWECEEILPNFPKFARKNSKENDLKKTIASHFKLGAFFSIRSTSSTNVAQISPNFPGFCGILSGFLPKEKFWGCGCTPLHSRLLHQCLNIMPVVFCYGRESPFPHFQTVLLHQVSATANEWKTKPQDILNFLG